MEIESKDDMNVKENKVIAGNDEEMPSEQTRSLMKSVNQMLILINVKMKNDCEQCGNFICAQCKIKVL